MQLHVLVLLAFFCNTESFRSSVRLISTTQWRHKVFNVDDLAITINIPPQIHAMVSNGISIQTAPTLAKQCVSVLSAFILQNGYFLITAALLIGRIFSLIAIKEETTLSSNAYNVQDIAQHYNKRNIKVAIRIFKMAFLSMQFNVGLILDFLTGKLQKNEKVRALDAANVLARLGPTYIKMGQALSIRADIISPAYAEGLQTLQDSVAPFDSAFAQKIICKELNITSLNERFKTFSPAPVASASIGQVYKATLLDGREVAVKVQRPNVASSILLDLYVLRTLTPVQVHLANIIAGMPTNRADIEMAYSLVDEWGRGLVGELDYLQEAANSRAFSEAMRRRGLQGIIAPEVVTELCTRKVLVTEWIEGTRLDRDSSDDIPRLCGTAVNAYLTMLLDTGTLHCDPHPGNLLRTKDGRLCILDWGMTLSVPQDLQYSLLEFIAHCNAQDFSHLAEDFVKLGTTPADKVEQVRQSGIPEGFAFIMKQLNAGGGPAQLTNRLRSEFKARYGDLDDAQLSLKCRQGMIHSELHLNSHSQLPQHPQNLLQQQQHTAVISGGGGNSGASGGSNVAGVTGVLEMMSKRNRDIFKLPSYMLYVARAFATLEGIGLSTDPNYSILRECYPYMAKRLLTDNTPRCRQVLRNMLYQDGKLCATKLVEFSEGFRSYTASTAHSGSTQQDLDTFRATQALTDVILDADNSLVQELLSDGVVMYGDSILREGISLAKHSTAGRLLRAVLRTPKTIVDLVVPDDFKVLVLPLTLPYDVAKAVGNLLDVTPEDAQNAQSARDLLQHLYPRPQRNALAVSAYPSPSVHTKTLPTSTRNTTNAGKVVPASPLRRVFSTVRRRLPGAVQLSRKVLASVLVRTAQRLDAPDHADTNRLEDINSEIELLVTESIGSIASTAAKTVAQVLV